jgi:hypothetical protein
MEWIDKSSATDAIARIKAGAYGANYASEFERMTGTGSASLTAMQEQAYINGALIADERAKANRVNSAASKASRSSGGGGGNSFLEERDKLLKDQLDATQDLIDSLRDMSDDLTKLREELIGSAFDPRNPSEKYATERANIISMGLQGAAGDMAAAEAFKSGVGDFLDLSQDYNASTPAYAADFARMIELLDNMKAAMDRQAEAATATLTVQQRGLGIVATNTGDTARSNDSMARSSRIAAQRTVE